MLLNVFLGVAALVSAAAIVYLHAIYVLTTDLWSCWGSGWLFPFPPPHTTDPPHVSELRENCQLGKQVSQVSSACFCLAEATRARFGSIIQTATLLSLLRLDQDVLVMFLNLFCHQSLIKSISYMLIGFSGTQLLYSIRIIKIGIRFWKSFRLTRNQVRLWDLKASALFTLSVDPYFRNKHVFSDSLMCSPCCSKSPEAPQQHTAATPAATPALTKVTIISADKPVIFFEKRKNNPGEKGTELKPDAPQGN